MCADDVWKTRFLFYLITVVALTFFRREKLNARRSVSPLWRQSNEHFCWRIHQSDRGIYVGHVVSVIYEYLTKLKHNVNLFIESSAKQGVNSYFGSATLKAHVCGLTNSNKVNMDKILHFNIYNIIQYFVTIPVSADFAYGAWCALRCTVSQWGLKRRRKALAMTPPKIPRSSTRGVDCNQALHGLESEVTTEKMDIS